MKAFYFCACFVFAFLLMECSDPVQSTAVTDPYKWSSGVTTISTDSQTVENLVVLGRVWGFLKYYHPVVASGKYNWDYELFKVMPKVIGAKTAEERNEVLVSWVDTLGDFDQLDVIAEVDTSIVKIAPDYSWISETYLGESLSDKLNSVVTAQRSIENHYVRLTTGVGNPEFTNEDTYDTLKFPDCGYRMLCLFRYWNMIEYFYPYKNLIQKSWSNVLTEYVPRFVGCKSELDYELCAIRMTTEIHDTHAYMLKGVDAFENFRGTQNAPVFISMIEGKAIVTGFADSAAEQQCGLMRGDMILTVDYKTVDSMYNERRENIRASNEPTALRNFCGSILVSKDASVHVVFEREGSTRQIDIKCYPRDTLKATSKPYYKIDSAVYTVEPGIACVFGGTVTISELNTSYTSLSLCKGIVVDMRNYPEEDFFNTLSKLTHPESTPFVTFTTTTITTPGLFKFGRNISVGRKNSACYQGKVVILVNENTQSAAEYHTMALSSAPNAIVIGSTTAGADGNVSEIGLPGGLTTMITGIGIYYPDGRETQRVGIVPDIEVHPTIKGIREGRDEVMEAAIAYINR